MPEGEHTNESEDSQERWRATPTGRETHVPTLSQGVALEQASLRATVPPVKPCR